MIKKIIKHIITGRDNTTVDIGRVSWLIAIIILSIGALYQITMGVVHLQHIAIAYATVSGIGGVAVAIKGGTEP